MAHLSFYFASFLLLTTAQVPEVLPVDIEHAEILTPPALPTPVLDGGWIDRAR